MSVAVVVQTVVGREASLARTLASLRETDVGEWEVVTDRVRKPGEAFLECLRRLEASGAERLVRIEDDATLNRHLRHNVATWAAVDDPRFGAGWLYTAGTIYDYIFGRKESWQRKWLQGGAVANVVRRADVPELADRCAAWMKNHGPIVDYALSNAVHVMGRWTCHHAPCLAWHRHEEPSTMTRHFGPPRINGKSFKRDWKRP